MKRFLIGVVTGVVIVTLPTDAAFAARSAPGAGGDTIVARGTCSAGSTWSLAARAAGRGIQVTARLQSAPGQRWRLSGGHSGVRMWRGSAVANRRGAVVVRRHTNNRPGVDTYQFGAVRKGARETCRGSLSY